MSEIKGFRDLIVYQKAYKLALQIFEISKAFPKEEKYSLTDQIRRSSRSVTANIAESWAKKKYIKAFVNKLTDALGEEYETEVWMDFSKDFKYVNQDTYDQIMSGYDEVRKMLISMINKPESFFR
jgi:four helix bundle protein